MTVIGVLFIYFYVPETKGRTLEEMDELFGEAGFAQADLDRKARIEREIGLTQLLDGDEHVAEKHVPGESDGKSDSDREVGEAIEHKN
jgi:hypothetical protein